MAEKILVHQWTNDKHRYRMIVEPHKHSPRDTRYVIDVQTQDSLGDPVWTPAHTFRDDKEGQVSVLLAEALMDLVPKTDPALESAFRTGGWGAVSEMLKGRR